MQAFEYAHPNTVQEAVALLGTAWGYSEVLAGGTDLLSLLKDYVVTPRRVVNIKGIRALEGIHSTAEGLQIGATVTFEELQEDRTVGEEFPALAQAAAGVSSPQIRNMGTVGGDLCQRPRCWYFRSGFGLLAKGENGASLVPGGENRYHAILGNDGPAYFVNPSSLAPALIALGATVRLFGPKGQREVALAEFFVIPKKDAERENVLQSNEILTAVAIPAASRGLYNATYEVRQREMLDWPLAAASVALRVQSGKAASAQIVLGHVAPLPWRAPSAAQWLEGRSITEETSAQAGGEALRGAKPLTQNAYKVQLARVAVKRALLAAMKGA
ncbi:MAG TPA: FAD binding domain-containing protein [Candidatus Acidoferrales bacterium]|jgi:xanthine dehydrogenase YagS FAD-binding subunit|nr:FAD binding domain-containing protein [Candidatus Acidoferrales bacterium]